MCNQCNRCRNAAVSGAKGIGSKKRFDTSSQVVASTSSLQKPGDLQRNPSDQIEAFHSSEAIEFSIEGGVKLAAQLGDWAQAGLGGSLVMQFLRGGIEPMTATAQGCLTSGTATSLHALRHHSVAWVLCLARLMSCAWIRGYQQVACC